MRLERTGKYRDRNGWSLRWPCADRHGNKVASSDAGHDSQWPPETTLVVTFDDVGGQTLTAASECF